MLLSEIVEDYLNHCRVERGLTTRTCKTFGSWLRFYGKWLAATGYDRASLGELNPTTLKRYLYHLASLKYRPRTIRAAFAALRGLCDYLKAQGALAENPVRSVTMPKLDAARRELVSDDEVRALLTACERLADPVKAARARGMFAVLCYAALRRQELLDLKLDDVHLKERCVVVRQGKGKKARTVYPHSDCLDALRQWLALRPRDCKHDWLWAFDRNRRIHDRGLNTLLAEVKAIAGLADHTNILPHSLRHNCATRYLRAGADIRAIQAMLGHSQLETTAIYLHTDEARQREISNLGGLEPSRRNSKPERRRRGRGGSGNGDRTRKSERGE